MQSTTFQLLFSFPQIIWPTNLGNMCLYLIVYLVSRIKIRYWLILVILIFAAGAGIVALAHKKPHTAIAQRESSGPASSAADIETTDFKYQQPAGWAKLSKATLDSSGAVSGIGRLSVPTATFMVKVANTVPANDTDLKTSTLAELHKLTKFELVSVTSTTVNGKNGVEFIYKFGGDKDRIQQDLRVVTYKGKTYFLLSNQPDPDLIHNNDLSAIVSSFKFK
jgi:hypothetical protein